MAILGLWGPLGGPSASEFCQKNCSFDWFLPKKQQKNAVLAKKSPLFYDYLCTITNFYLQ